MATTYLSRTPSSTSNRKTWTFSAWVKRTGFGAGNVIFDAGVYGGNNYSPLFFTPTGTIRFYEVVGGSLQWNVETTRKFNDCNGWYHIIMAVDTTQATTTNRVKLYINGIQETVFSPESVPSQNYDTLKNFSSQENNIGIASDNRLSPFDGLMSHIHFCDGQQLAPTVFGSTDSTTGEWKIITDPTFTPGTNGFTILKNGNTITDQSANSNNWSLGAGTLTKSEDNPSNVFATVNSLDSFYQNTTLSEGNLKIAFNNGWAFNTGTLGFNSGKWYWEVRSNSWSAGNQAFGITSAVSDAPGDEFYNNSGSGAGYGYYNNGYVYGNGGNFGQNWVNSGYGLIGMIAVDADNNKLYFGANGTWGNSANPSTGTNGISIVATSTQSTGSWFPAFSGGASSSGNDFKINFGNGHFGTTAVSSAGTNASGNGIFEYDVPTGYTALSTKGLNL